MARRAIGLDIGATSVRAAEVTLGPRPTLHRYGQVALPAGAVRDGAVVDGDAVTRALKDLWKHVKFGGKAVHLGVANQRVVVRQADLLWMPEKELKKALPMQVQDFIPMPIEEAQLDFVPISELTGDDGARLARGLLVAAGRDMILAAAEAAMHAGLKPASVDLSPFALMRALVRVDPLGLRSRPEALVDVGAQVTTILIHDNGSPRFVRFLLMGGAAVTLRLEDDLRIPTPEAEALKRTIGLDQAGSGDPDMQRAGQAIAAATATLMDEVRGSLDYYLATSGSAPLSRVLVTGGGALLPGFVLRLASVLRAPVESGRVLGYVTPGQTGLTAEQLGIVDQTAAIAVGLALGGGA